jgi:hypothetical protein
VLLMDAAMRRCLRCSSNADLNSEVRSDMKYIFFQIFLFTP